MFCRKCGAKLKDSAKFCGKCGAPVAIAVEPKKELVAPAETVKPMAPAVKPPKEKAMPPAVKPPRDTEPPEEKTVAPEEKPKLIVNMPGAKPVSSNGEFDRWFSDPGNL